MQQSKYPSLKKYNITNERISKILNYSTEASFNNSTARNRIKDGLESLVKQIEDTIIKKITG